MSHIPLFLKQINELTFASDSRSQLIGIELTALRDDTTEHQNDLKSRISDLETCLESAREDQERARVASDIDNK